MDIEDLSKSQLILLTILVNFVTSVATGILTVSLLDQAPPFVTQTVNRVVERTIETVAQAAPAAVVSAPAPSNQDLVTAAIGAAASRAVAIHSATLGTSSPAIAVGTYLPKARAVATVHSQWLPAEVFIQFPNGSFIAASKSKEDTDLMIYGFADNETLPKASGPALIAASDLKLGQTALAIGADGAASTGIVAKASKEGIKTTLPDIGTGSAVVDLAGNMIGLAVGTAPGLLVSASRISALLAATSTATTTSSSQ